MDAIAKLKKMRSNTGQTVTVGLPEAVLKEFISSDRALALAIDEGAVEQERLMREFPGFAGLPEMELVDRLQEAFVNFYAEDQRNPYVPVAARGPWIVTFHGAVLHDSGGYGMIGFGHGPEAVLAAMNRPHVMANVMTASFSQRRLTDALKKEIGHTRKDKPFEHFICVNSGSEAVTVAARISDINAKRLTDPGARHAGKKVMFINLKGSFHGRTDRPARLSNSSLKYYRDNLASFRNIEFAHSVAPNDIAGLKAAYDWAKRENVFFETLVLEPVMGEGNPGKAITPEFYQAARDLTEQEGTLLIVDSIQAGLRAQGCLSLCDYPGFEALAPPDMEAYSKAVNAGQYPLSILSLGAKAAQLYVRGVYGNTMTANPRALDVAVAALTLVTPALRRNVRERGQEFLSKFAALKSEFPSVITDVQGTGLLVSLAVDPKAHAVVGRGHLEEKLRHQGIGVIHGGVNSLRFTPHFAITSREIDLIVSSLRHAFQTAPDNKKSS